MLTSSRKSDCDCETVGLAAVVIVVFLGTVAWLIISVMVVHQDNVLQGWDECTCYPPISNVKFEGADSISMRWTGTWSFLCGDLNGTVVNQYPAVGSLWMLVGQTRSKVQDNLSAVQNVASIGCSVNPERTSSFTHRINILGWGFSLTLALIVFILEIGFAVKVFCCAK